MHGYRNFKTHTRDYSTPDHYNASDAVHVMEALNTRFSIVGWCEDGVRGIITAALQCILAYPNPFGLLAQNFVQISKMFGLVKRHLLYT